MQSSPPRAVSTLCLLCLAQGGAEQVSTNVESQMERAIQMEKGPTERDTVSQRQRPLRAAPAGRPPLFYHPVRLPVSLPPSSVLTEGSPAGLAGSRLWPPQALRPGSGLPWASGSLPGPPCSILFLRKGIWGPPAPPPPQRETQYADNDLIFIQRPSTRCIPTKFTSCPR